LAGRGGCCFHRKDVSMFPSAHENAVVSAKGGSALSEKPIHGERPRLLVGGTGQGRRISNSEQFE
jgi:hypothetical protein